jgi:hypothetical protein
MVQEVLKTGQVAATLGIGKKEIQNAVDGGYIRPATSGRGRGSLRLYRLEDVVRLHVFQILVNSYGIERPRAARMLSRAWPRPFQKRKKTLEIQPSAADNGGPVALKPIQLPLENIVRTTERRLATVLKGYREKKRGRPPGWARALRRSLAEVSRTLGNEDNESIRAAVAQTRSQGRTVASRS